MIHDQLRRVFSKMQTPQFNFISQGEESIWNVDGEILPAHRLSAQVFRGLINIFASGPID